MYWQVELILYVLLLTTAVVALQVRNLLAAVTVTTAFPVLNSRRSSAIC